MIVFRVDSSDKIGSGHLMRCIALAEKLKKYDDIIFISRNLPNNINCIVKEYGFKLNVLDFSGKYENYLGVTQEKDLQETVNILKTLNNVRYVIVDNYFIDKFWEDGLKKIFPEIKIAVIDDLADREHFCDILIDYGADDLMKYHNLINQECKLFLGRRFQIFRDEFYKEKEFLKKYSGKVKKFLIFFGGSDPTNETNKVLDAIEDANLKNLKFYIVVGACNKLADQIKTRIEAKKDNNIIFLFQVQNMAEIINDVDFCIGAGGVSAWERVFLGVPSCYVSVADNQDISAEKVSLNLPFIYIGKYSEVSSKTYTNIINWAIENPAKLLDMHKKAMNIYKDNLLNINTIIKSIIGVLE